MHSPKRAAQAEWRGAHVTTPPASSIEKRGSGGSAETTWNIAPSFSRSSSAKRRSARTWGLKLTPKTSTLEFGWVWTNKAKGVEILHQMCFSKTDPSSLYDAVASRGQGITNITYTWATLSSISWAAILHYNYTSGTLQHHQRIQNCKPHLHIFHSASQTNAPLFAAVVGLGG